ncbi:MAG: cation:proton antiporter [Spirochaetes bacterium]|nr:cation:proton antiporter [Spirochaetota bacterium]
MEYHIALTTIIATIVVGSLCIAIAERTGTPAILYFFASGILLGRHALGIIDPESLGGGLRIIISLFVSIILFEGGLSLDVPGLRQINRALLRQIILTILIMCPAAFLAAYFIMGMSREASLTFASLCIVTGPTVIKPILRHIPLRNSVKTFLNGESVIIDAVGAVLAIVVLDFVLSTQFVHNAVLTFFYSIGFGILSGAIFGLVMRFLLAETRLIGESVKSIFLLGVLFLNYIASESIIRESGLMAVAVFGIIMSTMDFSLKDSLLSFKDRITQIIISILFILLSAQIDYRMLTSIALEGSIVVILLVLIRFPIVFASTMGEALSAMERLFIGWIGPRGIIGFSVASLAAIKLREAGIGDSGMIVPLIFLLMAVTVLLQGLSAGLLARRMRITVYGDRNILLLGVNDISLTVAEQWRTHGNDVLFIDSFAKNHARATGSGFPCILGNGLSARTYTSIDVEHFNSAFAVTSNDEINVLFCRFMKDNYGISHLYCLLSSKSSEELDDIIRFSEITTMHIPRTTMKWRNLVDSIFLLLKKMRVTSCTVRLKDIEGGDVAEYSQQNECHLLCVIRGDECHIHSPAMRLEPEDELIFISGGKIKAE